MHSSSLTIPKQDGGVNNSSNLTSQGLSYRHSHTSAPLKRPTMKTRAQNAWTAGMGPVKIVWDFLQKWTNLTVWIIVGMVVGILVGRFSPDFAVKIGPLGTVFIRMIQCIVVSPVSSSCARLQISDFYLPTHTSFLLRVHLPGPSYFHNSCHWYCRPRR